MTLPQRLLRLLAAIALVASVSCNDDPVEPRAVTDVFTPGNTFSPFTTTITAGSIVRFNIYGDDHNVIFTPGTPGAPANINVVRDVTVQRTFDTVGDFPYSCTVHPGMNGEIIVK